MPRHIIGPFNEFQDLPDVDIAAAYAENASEAAIDALLDRMELIRGVLESAGCFCVGHAAGTERDSEWGADISELVDRCAMHEIHGTDTDGQPTVENVCIKLSSLLAEVDGNGEVCAWMYEES